MRIATRICAIKYPHSFKIIAKIQCPRLVASPLSIVRKRHTTSIGVVRFLTDNIWLHQEQHLRSLHDGRAMHLDTMMKERHRDAGPGRLACTLSIQHYREETHGTS